MAENKKIDGLPVTNTERSKSTEEGERVLSPFEAELNSDKLLETIMGSLNRTGSPEDVLTRITRAEDQDAIRNIASKLQGAKELKDKKSIDAELEEAIDKALEAE